MKKTNWNDDLFDFSCRKAMSFGEKLFVGDSVQKTELGWQCQALLANGDVEQIFLRSKHLPSSYLIVLRGHQNGDEMFYYDAVAANRISEYTDKVEEEIFKAIDATFVSG